MLKESLYNKEFTVVVNTLIRKYTVGTVPMLHITEIQPTSCLLVDLAGFDLLTKTIPTGAGSHLKNSELSLWRKC